MAAAWNVVLLAALGAWAAAPTVLRHRLGPIELEGRHLGLRGPAITKSVLIREPGWVRGMSVRLKPRPGSPSAPDRLSLAVLGELDVYELRGAPLLLLGPGQERFVLPEGTGVPVEPGRAYMARVFLRSDVDVREAYDVELDIDFVARRPDAALRDVKPVGLRLGAVSEDGALSTGRRELSRDVPLPAGKAVAGLVLLSSSLREARLETPGGRSLFPPQAPGEAFLRLPPGGARVEGAGHVLRAVRASSAPEPDHAVGVLFIEEDAR